MSFFFQLPRRITIPAGVSGQFTSIAWSPDGTCLAAVFCDALAGRVRVFNVPSPELNQDPALMTHPRMDSIDNVSCGAVLVGIQSCNNVQNGFFIHAFLFSCDQYFAVLSVCWSEPAPALSLVTGQTSGTVTLSNLADPAQFIEFPPPQPLSSSGSSPRECAHRICFFHCIDPCIHIPRCSSPCS
jgi:hypothetical protein